MSAAVAGASTEERPQPDEEPAAQRIIKQEKDSDIKDYAETTMNELLGWYGYDKLDTRGLNLKTLRHHPFQATSSSSSSPRQEDDVSEEDTGQSTSPAAESEAISSNPSAGTTIICAWCLKMGLKLFTLKTASGETKEFCSEPCFNQCRRAAFKKNRVCNWCRHVRHTVNYVDFQDGDDQLQFCSDKCLNQYKMQIFCKETQAYLQMNPHLQEEASKITENSKLITPDLWLRDCHESTNGGINHSGDEAQDKPNDKDELEDLSLTSKTEQNNLSNKLFPQEHDIHKNITVPNKENIVERCNSLASYFSDDKEKTDRKKRHNELSRENSRKRQRISFRNKMIHPSEAPPAHLSSKHSSLSYQNQSSIFPPSTSFNVPLRSKSPVLINPPAAHSKSYSPHPGMAGSVIHPGLPPPPPLLSNDFYPPPFNPQFFSPQQQQLDAVLRMQASLSSSASFASNYYHESMLPLLRSSAPPNTNSVPQPNTVMLPYPIFVPLPIPIPIPLPLKSFVPKQKPEENILKENIAEKNESCENYDKAAAKNSKNPANDDTLTVPNSKKQETSSTSSDTDEHKLLKKTRKR